MVNQLTKFFLILFFLLTSLFSQTNEQIEKQNKILNNLKAEISSLQNSLDKLSNQEKQSVRTLQTYNQQTVLLSRLIAKLKKEEKQKETEITRLTKSISELEREIESLKEDYSRYVVWLYKNRKGSFLKFLLGAESLNQAVIRYKYLTYITDKNEETLAELKSKQTQLKKMVELREDERTRKQELVAEKEEEKSTLNKKKEEKENLLVELKEDQQQLLDEIDQKRKAEIEIKNLIARLIEEERERLEEMRLARLKDEKYEYDYTYDDFENFSSLQGELNWPVHSGSIRRDFGENRNEKLNTVTLNYGVDIETEKEENVYAVAEGIVSAIEWIPGYGSVIIITHKNNFRTVYGHLSEIHVNEGDKVGGGTELGKVNESLEGNILHFEIWNERNYQNPEVWLVEK